MKKWFKQLWIWILLLDHAYLFLFWPLQEYPETLYPILPEGCYEIWEEFAVMHLDGFLANGMLFLLLAALGGGCFIAEKAKGWKKAGILCGYLCLALWTLFCGMPGLGQAREKPRCISCKSNMKQIGLALGWYAGENEGFYPPDLRTLLETDYLTDERIYRCPSRRRPNPEFSDYQYLGKGRQREEPAFPILRDLPKNHPGKYCNILYSNNEVSTETE